MKKPCGFCYGIFAFKLPEGQYNDAKHLITAKHHNSPQANITEKRPCLATRSFFLVEMAVVETASENPLPQLSTSVSVLLGFPSGDAGRQASPYGSL